MASVQTPVVTLFGGAGFVGRSLIPRLTRLGWSLKIASRNPRKALALMPAGAVGQIQALPTDITDPASIGRALDGATMAVNLVGILAESGGRQSFAKVQTEGAAAIAKAAAERGLQRLVHLSSTGAINPTSAYGRSKAEGEKQVAAAFPAMTLLRCNLIFGEQDAFFNRFARMARMAPVLPFAGGSTRFQPVYVEDVAEAIARCLTLPMPQVAGQTYDLAGPEVHRFDALMAMMLKEIRRSPMLFDMPIRLAESMGKVMQMLPGAPLTYDQVQDLKRDHLPPEGSRGLEDLGITATPLHFVLPNYLWQYRPGGRFSNTPTTGA